MLTGNSFNGVVSLFTGAGAGGSIGLGSGVLILTGVLTRKKRRRSRVWLLTRSIDDTHTGVSKISNNAINGVAFFGGAIFVGSGTAVRCCSCCPLVGLMAGDWTGPRPLTRTHSSLFLFSLLQVMSEVVWSRVVALTSYWGGAGGSLYVGAGVGTRMMWHLLPVGLFGFSSSHVHRSPPSHRITSNPTATIVNSIGFLVNVIGYNAVQGGHVAVFGAWVC